MLPSLLQELCSINWPDWPQLAFLFAAVVGAIFAYWRYATADKALRQQQFLEAASQFSKETSREINPSAIIRLCSAVTLKRLAQRYPAEFHVVVMVIFAAYLGSPSVLIAREDSVDDPNANQSKVAPVIAPDDDTTREIIKFTEGRTKKQKKQEAKEQYTFQLPLYSRYEMRDDGKLYLTEDAAIASQAFLKHRNIVSPFLTTRHPTIQ
ncbi:MAG: hypothetical protein OXE94_13555 [Aestuariivita sp.]|nr:hypothetical protein [Aestuariivita sp.]MCY4203043.1 hypothetical protein [Aestuariivita sp.]